MRTGIYKCPICDEGLNQVVKSLQCSNRHTFDIARQGCVNLLLSNKSKDKVIGDDADMVQGRTNFLNNGHYQFLANTLSKLVVANLSEKDSSQNPFYIVDAGCGEGYYTDDLSRSLIEADLSCGIFGVDISKPACTHAAKRNNDLSISVGSVYKLPFLNNSANIITSVFSPVSSAEFSRVLKDDGIVVMVGPQPEHLRSIAALIYDNVKPHEGNDDVLLVSREFILVKTIEIEKEIHLDSSGDIKSLIMMTPYYWSIPLSKKGVFDSLTTLDTTASFRISIYQKKK